LGQDGDFETGREDGFEGDGGELGVPAKATFIRR
jgi:hypothetical protein